MPKTRVLFLCTGNSARSQMAEALLRFYAGDHFEVFSAGLEPKGINPNTIQVMEELGCDMSSHTAKPLSQYLGKAHFGYLITVCSKAEEQCPIFPGMGVRLHWPFEDPAAFQGSKEETLAKFRQVRDQISARVLEWLSEQGIEPRQPAS
ncbi:MAG: arsenate reductase ArsC [Anaerolineae bacterium]|nr:arsenate reductase ArsC [Anaerolineae bacterium]